MHATIYKSVCTCTSNITYSLHMGSNIRIKNINGMKILHGTSSGEL